MWIIQQYNVSRDQANQLSNAHIAKLKNDAALFVTGEINTQEDEVFP